MSHDINDYTFPTGGTPEYHGIADCSEDVWLMLARELGVPLTDDEFTHKGITYRRCRLNTG